MMSSENAPAAVIRRLHQVINRHDLDALVDCFASDYQSEFPAHPGRAFSGNDGVRQNWSRLFATMPNLEALLLRDSVEGDVVWAEWEWRGTRRDSESFVMRGVTIQGTRDGRLAWARLYMEPVASDDAVSAPEGGER